MTRSVNFCQKKHNIHWNFALTTSAFSLRYGPTTQGKWPTEADATSELTWPSTTAATTSATTRMTSADFESGPSHFPRKI